MTLRTVLSTVLVAAVLASGGCTPRTAASASSPGKGNVLSQTEIMTANATTLHEAVQRLRPGWLRTRAASSINRPEVPVQVYVDGVRMGGPGALGQLSAGSVVRVQYLEPNDAELRYGMDHGNGVILVDTR